MNKVLSYIFYSDLDEKKYIYTSQNYGKIIITFNTDENLWKNVTYSCKCSVVGNVNRNEDNGLDFYTTCHGVFTLDGYVIDVCIPKLDNKCHTIYVKDTSEVTFNFDTENWSDDGFDSVDFEYDDPVSDFEYGGNVKLLDICNDKDEFENATEEALERVNNEILVDFYNLDLFDYVDSKNGFKTEFEVDLSKCRRNRRY